MITLTENAKEIMGKIAKVSEKGTGQINVSGHTDNVPLIFGGQYRDNWDLAAARAASLQATSSGKRNNNLQVTTTCGNNNNTNAVPLPGWLKSACPQRCPVAMFGSSIFCFLKQCVSPKMELQSDLHVIIVTDPNTGFG